MAAHDEHANSFNNPMTKHKNYSTRGQPVVSKQPPSSTVKIPTASTLPSAEGLTVPTRPKTFVSRVKSWAWRFTAGYFWMHSALMVISGHDPLSGLETGVTTKAVALLSFLGFAPVNVGHLPLVFLVIWLLAIAGFSPIQLLIGLPLYVAVFPITVLGALLYHKMLKANTDSSASETGAQAARHFPLVSLSAALLVGWFVLYSGSSSRGPNLAGFLLSLVLFFALLYQALDKTSPIDDHDTAFFSNAALRGILMVTNVFKKATEEPPKTKAAAESLLKINGFVIGGFRRLAVVIHGRKGRERIAMAILIEYIVFLILVAVSAILFWALAIKAVVPSERALPLTTALQISASHFLPGIQESSSTTIPWWAEFGPAFTSWVLFVVYIGPVGAAVPVRQESFLKRLIPAQRAFQLIGRFWRLYRKFIKAAVKDKPPK